VRVNSRFRALRQRAHLQLKSWPRLRQLLDTTGALRGETETIARGIGIGLFIGLTPTVGFQIVLMIIGCLLMRGNFPAAFAVSWISNPLTMAPLYWGFHNLGKAVFGRLIIFTGENGYLGKVGNEMLFTLLGSLLIAAPSAILGYHIALRVLAAYSARRKRARQQ